MAENGRLIPQRCGGGKHSADFQTSVKPFGETHCADACETNRTNPKAMAALTVKALNMQRLPSERTPD
jgi:hypothetical protein